MYACVCVCVYMCVHLCVYMCVQVAACKVYAILTYHIVFQQMKKSDDLSEVADILQSELQRWS